jgi:hypothetical protein
MIGIALAILPATTSIAQIDSGTKNPIVAGVASYLFPGLGSLYAGNDRHAAIHLAVAGGSVAAIMGAMADVNCTTKHCSPATQVLAYGGLMTYGVNYVWSLVSAVRDANAHNAAVAALRPGDSLAAEPPHHGFLHGMNLSVGSGGAPYLGSSTGAQTTEVRLGFTLGAMPDWTFTYAHSGVRTTRSTDYFVPACDGGRGCYPHVYVDADAFELQRRWHREARVHPIAAASVGGLTSRYSYQLRPGVPFAPATWDSTQYRQFASVSGGLEADLWSWLHAVAYGGYRQATSGTVPNGTSSNSGPTFAWLVEIGKF